MNLVEGSKVIKTGHISMSNVVVHEDGHVEPRPPRPLTPIMRERWRMAVRYGLTERGLVEWNELHRGVEWCAMHGIFVMLRDPNLSPWVKGGWQAAQGYPQLETHESANRLGIWVHFAESEQEAVEAAIAHIGKTMT